MTERQIKKYYLVDKKRRTKSSIQRPRTRGDCSRVPRPCPFVSCIYNLYLDITQKGSLKLNFPKMKPEEMPISCALDVAEYGGCTLQEVGDALNICRERVRQIEEAALRKLEDQKSLKRYLIKLED